MEMMAKIGTVGGAVIFIIACFVPVSALVLIASAAIATISWQFID
jgi:hypothetical protein